MAADIYQVGLPSGQIRQAKETLSAGPSRMSPATRSVLQVTDQRDNVVAAFSLLAARPAASTPPISASPSSAMSRHDYEQVRDKWFGFSTLDVGDCADRHAISVCWLGANQCWPMWASGLDRFARAAIEPNNVVGHLAGILALRGDANWS